MIEIGKTAVSILLKRKRAYLIIIAADASAKLKNQIQLDCFRQGTPVYIFSTRSDLGQICGRDEVATIAISDKNLAAGIKNVLAE